MHTTHIILVNLEYAELNQESKIIHYAENATDVFQHYAFDWRTVQDVIIGSNKPDELLNLLEQCLDTQQQQITQYLKVLNNNLGDSLSQIVSTLSNDNTFTLEFNELAKLLAGEYTFESGFFDTEWCTSRIDEDTLQAIRESPENYTLVLFDCHN